VAKSLIGFMYFSLNVAVAALFIKASTTFSILMFRGCSYRSNSVMNILEFEPSFISYLSISSLNESYSNAYSYIGECDALSQALAKASRNSIKVILICLS
jgi:hypothetical protein